jgi:hypothetical protein
MMVAFIMLACIIGFIGGLIAFVKSLGKRKWKKAFVWLVIVILSIIIYQTVGTDYWAKHPQEQVQQQEEPSPDKKDEDEEKIENQVVKPDPKDITKAECEQVKYHMRYEDVRKIATYDAEITSSEQIGNELVEHAVWRNSDGSILEVVMKNKIVTNWWGVCERK